MLLSQSLFLANLTNLGLCYNNKRFLNHFSRCCFALSSHYGKEIALAGCRRKRYTPNANAQEIETGVDQSYLTATFQLEHMNPHWH